MKNEMLIPIMLVVLNFICSTTQGMFFPAFTNIKDINDQNMILAGTAVDGAVTVYTTKNSKLSVGKAELSSLHYAFYKDLLYEVFITTKGKSNFEYLKEFLFNYYGKGVQRSESIDNWYWLHPDGNSPSLYITLKYYPENKVTTLRISYNSMHDLIMQDSEKAASNGKENFLVL